MKTLIIIFFTFCLFIYPQTNLQKDLRGYTSPDEVITLSSNIPFNQAIELLSKISELKTGRKIVATISRNEPIGLEIKNMQYEKALLLVVQYAGLMYEIKEDVIVVKKKAEPKEIEDKNTYAEASTREVKISAVFIEIDVTKARQRGINWSFLLGDKNSEFGGTARTTGEILSTDNQSNASSTTQNQLTTDFNITTNSTFQAGNFVGNALSLFRFLENENIGEVIASPNITVRDRQAGRIQVGSDISIKQRDFSGNVIESFFSTGSIIKVTPYIYNEDSLEFVLLDLDVERSSGFPSEVSTEIKKTTAKTQVLMLDGEETMIGGLFLNEEQSTRVGIPFLKDLPWWVLGIRYLTGSDQTSVVKKELVILIKLELLPRLKDRMKFPQDSNVLENSLNELRERAKQNKVDTK
jgi:type IV pilus assembly protein PilQ